MNAWVIKSGQKYFDGINFGPFHFALLMGFKATAEQIIDSEIYLNTKEGDRTRVKLMEQAIPIRVQIQEVE